MDYFTILSDRCLWFDGDNTVSPKDLSNFLATNSTVAKNTFVTELTKDIMQYNTLVPPDSKIVVKKTIKPFDFSWSVPDSYKTLNLEEYALNNLIELCECESNEIIQKRWKRAKYELREFHRHDMEDVLRVIIYVVETLKKNKVVWGVGRGSSVSSYLLYLYGVHDIDSFDYDLDFHEFMREND